jgi:hypothetical protein
MALHCVTLGRVSMLGLALVQGLAGMCALGQSQQPGVLSARAVKAEARTELKPSGSPRGIPRDSTEAAYAVASVAASWNTATQAASTTGLCLDTEPCAVAFDGIDAAIDEVACDVIENETVRSPRPGPGERALIKLLPGNVGKNQACFLANISFRVNDTCTHRVTCTIVLRTAESTDSTSELIGSPHTERFYPVTRAQGANQQVVKICVDPEHQLSTGWYTMSATLAVARLAPDGVNYESDIQLDTKRCNFFFDIQNCLAQPCRTQVLPGVPAPDDLKREPSPAPPGGATLTKQLSPPVCCDSTKCDLMCHCCIPGEITDLSLGRKSDESNNGTSDENPPRIGNNKFVMHVTFRGNDCGRHLVTWQMELREPDGSRHLDSKHYLYVSSSGEGCNDFKVSWSRDCLKPGPYVLIGRLIDQADSGRKTLDCKSRTFYLPSN